MRRAAAFCMVMGLALACGSGAEKKPPDGRSPAPSNDGTAVPSPDAEAEAPDPDAPPVRGDGTILAESVLMGTRVTVNLWLDSDHTASEAGVAIEAAFDEMARLENEVLSEWKPDSAVSRLNAAAGARPLVVPRELFEVLSRSGEISASTGGAFDITFHGVGQLWTFEPGSRPPTKAEIETHLPLVDYRKVELDASATSARLSVAGMKVGLGAVAKGYIVAAATAVLKRKGFEHHIVEGGGDTYVSGTKNGDPWVIGVQDPTQQGAVGRIPATNEAVVTSGNYERFFEFEGKRYAHIIDPRTGWPLPYDESPRSVTVVASDATVADAYATALTVMGTVAGAAFVERTDEIEAVIIAADGQVHVSSGLEGRYTPLRPADGP